MGISCFFHFILIVCSLIVEVNCQNSKGYDSWRSRKCMKNDNKNEAGLCVPRCEDTCVNGKCNTTNQCDCKDGYFFNEKLLSDFGIKNITVCTPKCEPSCQNGVCITGNQCKCDPGYTWNKSTCEPVCDRSWINCTHGNCSSPNKCICNQGYILSKDSCIPICEPPCVNGKCIEPGKCLCSDGFHKSDQSHICAPSCNPPCINGDCVGVNQCSCLNGYKKFNNSFCTPSCDPKYILVENGECIAPNILLCNPEYKLEHSPYNFQKCESRCNPSCVNASCTENGTCQCNHGYDKIPRSFHACKPVCVTPCQNGQCVEPNTCKCESRFGKFNDSTSCRPVCSNCTGDLCINLEVCQHEMITAIFNFCNENCWSIVAAIIGIITTIAIIVLASKRFFKEDISSSFECKYDPSLDRNSRENPNIHGRESNLVLSRVILPQAVFRAERSAIGSEIYEEISYPLYDNLCSKKL